MIAIVILISAVMVGATWVALAKAGEKDGICKYGQDEERR